MQYIIFCTLAALRVKLHFYNPSNCNKITIMVIKINKDYAGHQTFMGIYSSYLDSNQCLTRDTLCKQSQLTQEGSMYIQVTVHFNEMCCLAPSWCIMEVNYNMYFEQSLKFICQLNLYKYKKIL